MCYSCEKLPLNCAYDNKYYDFSVTLLGRYANLRGSNVEGMVALMWPGTIPSKHFKVWVPLVCSHSRGTPGFSWALEWWRLFFNKDGTVACARDRSKTVLRTSVSSAAHTLRARHGSAYVSWWQGQRWVMCVFKGLKAGIKCIQTVWWGDVIVCNYHVGAAIRDASQLQGRNLPASVCTVSSLPDLNLNNWDHTLSAETDVAYYTFCILRFVPVPL